MVKISFLRKYLLLNTSQIAGYRHQTSLKPFRYGRFANDILLSWTFYGKLIKASLMLFLKMYRSATILFNGGLCPPKWHQKPCIGDQVRGIRFAKTYHNKIVLGEWMLKSLQTLLISNRFYSNIFKNLVELW